MKKKAEGYYLKINSLLFELGYILLCNFRVKYTKALDINSQKYLHRLSVICEYVMENYSEDLTLNHVAAHFGYSHSIYLECFKNIQEEHF